MAEKAMKKNSQKGFTLIGLIIAAAILGILMLIALSSYKNFIPGTSEIKTDVSNADAAVNESNADLLTSIARLIYAEEGNYPEWPATFASMGTGSDGTRGHTDEIINYLPPGSGVFKYDSATGTVSSAGT
jgi:prepilin-type N-terminal cleavage/methylation domain-containing protein